MRLDLLRNENNQFRNLKNGRRILSPRFQDSFFSFFLKTPGFFLLCLLTFILAFLIIGSMDSVRQFGFSFFLSKEWNPVFQKFGALPAIYGTVVSSLIGLAVATPLSIAAALVLTEFARGSVGRIIGFLLEMLAAIPNVVYGIWGIFIFAPWLSGTIQPALNRIFFFLPIFSKPFYGIGMFCAGLILAIMITPTIASLAREIFSSVPRHQREAALALGATKWETIVLSVLRSSKRGIVGAMILGLGRALGETMAVTMVIGNRPHISKSIFAPAATLSSMIANEYAEASDRLHLSSLMELGLSLFIVTFVFNSIARLYIATSNRRRSR